MGADGLSATLLWVTCPPGRTHPGFCCGPRGWRVGWALHARSFGSIPVTFPSVTGVDRGVWVPRVCFLDGCTPNDKKK